ncbi:MAG TPA: hypothetical protein PKA53_05000 [Sphingobacterium sp.]|nr:hypothetical protein [Sphingobacterium sp.]
MHEKSLEIGIHIQVGQVCVRTLPVFDHVYAKLKENTDAYPKNTQDTSKVITHRDLLNTLKNGDPELFRSQMRTHLMVYFKQLSTD